MIRIRPTPAVLPTSLAQGSATQTGTGGGEPALASRPAPLPSANPRSLELSPASGATVHLAGGQGTPLPLDGPVGVPINTEADVEWVQQRLVAMGRLEESAITGQMNEATAAAVRALQVDEGLRPDGVISPEMTTNEALNADAETPRTLTGRVQERDVDEHNLPGNVAAVERALRTREELAGDEPWLEALLNFQSRFMSRPDGVISPGGTTARLLNTPRSQWDSILVRRDTLLSPAPEPAHLEALNRAADAWTALSDIDRAEAMLQLMTFASIESGFDASLSGDSYIGLFQMSDSQFAHYFPGDRGKILDAGDNALAFIHLIQAKADRFEANFGEPPTSGELYMLHQQGEIGYRIHRARPDEPAWINMNMASMLESRRPEERDALLIGWVEEGLLSADVAQQLRDLPHVRPPVLVANSLDHRFGTQAIGGNLSREMRSRIEDATSPGLYYPRNRDILGRQMLDIWTQAVEERRGAYGSI